MSLPLDFLRNLQTAYLPDTCSISRLTETASGDGTAESWTTAASGVSCRVSPLASGANERLGGGMSVEAVADWTVWLPYGQDVRVTDRIVFGSRTFEVARVGARSYETARECICREIT